MTKADVSPITAARSDKRKGPVPLAGRLKQVRKKPGEGKKKEQGALSGRTMVYKYIQEQMKEGALLPGSVLDLHTISKTLGISMTPLRDSLIRLEAEGYLTIYPRSKVVINTLGFVDFPFLYDIMGALEYTTISSSIDLYTDGVLDRMRTMNVEMRKAINAGDLRTYDTVHYAFHDIFFQISANVFAERILMPIKNRLWDFPRKNFVIGWYHAAIDEHEWIVESIAQRDVPGLMHNIKELHWGFAYNEEYIRKTYNF